MDSLQTTSWRMIRQAACGVPADAEAFAQRYLPAVRAFFAARWRRTPLVGEVEEAVQEVFVECFRPGGALPKADPHRSGGFRAFFFGVLRNVAQRFEQRAGRRPRPQHSEPDQLLTARGHDPSVSQILDRKWAQDIMRRAAELQRRLAVAKGDAALRRVELLRLRFQEHQPIRAIARLWQIDAAFLHHEYAQARVEFEAALREVVGEFAAPGESEQVLRRLLAALG